jgi:hypothetical protein
MGKNPTSGNIFQHHRALPFQGQTAHRVVIGDETEGLLKRPLEAALGRQFQTSQTWMDQLDVCVIRLTD